ATYQEGDGIRWLMSSDVCKHCTEAACLEVCPTGALFRTEFDTVVVQQDVCNGCGYCVPACPFGVLDRREGDGRVWKCTLCYDRLKDDKEPACAQACPTNSIQFGELSELRGRAEKRLQSLTDAGARGAQLYLAGEQDGMGGASAGLAYACELRGAPVLAQRAWAVALAGVGVSPALLISDLGKPSRFLNMLRMFKVTSPMSVGSWVLACSGAATGISALSSLSGRLRRPAMLAKPAAAMLGMPLASYTGGLIAQTAVPAWHEARRELPALFAAGAAA